MSVWTVKPSATAAEWHCVVLAVRGYENMKLPQSVEELKIYTVRLQWFVENSRAVSSLEVKLVRGPSKIYKHIHVA